LHIFEDWEVTGSVYQVLLVLSFLVFELQGLYAGWNFNFLIAGSGFGLCCGDSRVSTAARR
jgi:hypothetical protein